MARRSRAADNLAASIERRQAIRDMAILTHLENSERDRPYQTGFSGPAIYEVPRRRRKLPKKTLAFMLAAGLAGIGYGYKDTLGPLALRTCDKANVNVCHDRLTATSWPEPIASAAQFPNVLKKTDSDPAMIGGLAMYSIAGLQYRTLADKKTSEFNIMLTISIDPTAFDHMMPKVNGVPKVAREAYTPERYIADLASNGQKLPQYKQWCLEDASKIVETAKEYAPALLAGVNNNSAASKPSITADMLKNAENYYTLAPAYGANPPVSAPKDNPDVPNVYISYMAPQIDPATKKPVEDPATKQPVMQVYNLSCAPTA